MPYPYLESWTAVNMRPAGGALKQTGEINKFMLGSAAPRDARHRDEARNTFANLIGEIGRKIEAGRPAGPGYRLLELTAAQQLDFRKDRIYVSPCFEAYSLARLQPGGDFMGANTRFVIIDAQLPAVDLREFNPQQQEVLVAPGTLFAVTVKRTALDNAGVTEIGLTYIGGTAADGRRGQALAARRGVGA